MHTSFKSYLFFMKTKDKNKASSLLWVEKIAVLMDSKFTIPGTKFKYGLDPILGLLPVIGDLTSFAISCTLLLYMARFGVSRKVVILMIGNIIVDTVIGSIPIIGNLFDFTFKANNRNIRLLRKHYVEGKYEGSGTGILLIVAAAIVVTIGLVIFTVIIFFRFLYDFIVAIF